MVKNRVRDQDDHAELELSETAHLRRRFLPAQPIQEAQPAQKKNERRTFRGLRRQVSLSMDSVMRNGLFRAGRSSDEEVQENCRKEGERRNLRSTLVRKETEKPTFEVQHNNASRLRMNQTNKPQPICGDRVK